MRDVTPLEIRLLGVFGRATHPLVPTLLIIHDDGSVRPGVLP